MQKTTYNKYCIKINVNDKTIVLLYNLSTAAGVNNNIISCCRNSESMFRIWVNVVDQRLRI